MERSFLRNAFLLFCLGAFIFLIAPPSRSQPDSPRDLNPKDGAMLITLETILSWGSSMGADGYELEIREEDTAGNRTSIFTMRTEGLNFPLKDIPSGKIAGNTVYHWRVRAYSGNNESNPEWSEWSEASFQTPPICDRENDNDCDGIPNPVEKEHFLTDPDKKTLFIRPVKVLGEYSENWDFWAEFKDLFPGSAQGRANITAFVHAGIEVVIVGDPDNQSKPFKGRAGFAYTAENHPEWPCDILNIFLVQNHVFEHGGHIYIIGGSLWTWSTKGMASGFGALGEYGIPKLYQEPLENYFKEGAYEKIAEGESPVIDPSGNPITNCNNEYSPCDGLSTLNLNAYGLFTMKPDETVEFNTIAIDQEGTIHSIDFQKTPGKGYSQKEVLARTVTHEMGHALLGVDLHCTNPCCIMYSNVDDWEQRLFGECLQGDTVAGKNCIHSPGESRDIRNDWVIHNTSHFNFR